MKKSIIAAVAALAMTSAAPVLADTKIKKQDPFVSTQAMGVGLGLGAGAGTALVAVMAAAVVGVAASSGT